MVPYFVFERELRPVPLSPTHCRRCRAELEPLRRWGGLCRRCVARRSRPAPKPTERLQSRLTLVREFIRKRTSGARVGLRESYVEVRCSCGQLSVMKRTRWMLRRPACCNRCRLRGVDKCGFEAEFWR